MNNFWAVKGLFAAVFSSLMKDSCRTSLYKVHPTPRNKIQTYRVIQSLGFMGLSAVTNLLFLVREFAYFVRLFTSRS